MSVKIPDKRKELLLQKVTGPIVDNLMGGFGKNMTQGGDAPSANAVGQSEGAMSRRMNVMEPAPPSAAPPPQPIATPPASTPGLSSPGATGQIDPNAKTSAMQRRMGPDDPNASIAEAQAALSQMPEHYQRQYGPTLKQARQYGGYA